MSSGKTVLRVRNDGTEETAMYATPARRARSRATSGAFHVGTRSSQYDSSCSSITTIDAIPTHGAQTPERAPITTSTPLAARDQSSGITATTRPRRRKLAAPNIHIRIVGHNANTGPLWAAAAITDIADCSGGTTITPPPCSISNRVDVATPSSVGFTLRPR